MNTIKFLVHESFEVSGFCTWPSWSVYHDIGRWLVGCFVKNEIRDFLHVSVEMTYKCSQMNTMKVLVHESRVWWVLHLAKLVGAPRHR